MEWWMHTITLTHVVAGIVSLVAAPVALVVLKGSKVHRSAGKVFFWAMTWIFLSAVLMSINISNPFLLMIAVFSYYLVVNGYRSVYQKQPGTVQWYDWFAMFISSIFNIGFIAWGGRMLWLGGAGFFAYLAIAFGLAGLIIALTQWKSFTSSSDNKYRWLFAHIGNMIGGFIASVTAFSTNVMVFLPGIIQWIWPSVIGVPLISFWIYSYRKKLSNNVHLNDLVELKR